MAITWSIHDAMDDAAIECSIPRPSSWVSATGTNEVTLTQFLKRTADELIRRNDWSQLLGTQTISGTGDASYDLESDYLRLAGGDNAVYENAPNDRPCIPVYRPGDWVELQERNWAGVQRFYFLSGSGIGFFQALPSGGTVTLSYVKKHWLTASDGTTPSNEWTVDSQVSLLPGHLLTLGVIWRFRRHKGLQYADRQVEYEAELARAIADDRPVMKVAFDGSRNTPRNPFEIPVPDYIPPA